MPTNQTPLLPFITERIVSADPKLGVRVQSFVAGSSPEFHRRAEEFFGRYKNFIEQQGRSIEFGIDCFLRLHRSVEQQRIDFLRTGKYENTSFAEVLRNVYSNPEVMQDHMHGLVFAQFFWPDQYHRFEFFSDQLGACAGEIRRYLEIGGGHALYVTEAVRALPATAEIDVVDISETSLGMAKGIAPEPRIRYHLMDIFDFPDGQYDFVTMGEVVEHVERPQDLLSKVRRLLAPDGRAYITTPANAPMRDHIYLFRNAQEIRDMFDSCGFRIERETSRYAVDVHERLAERMKLPLMYAALVSRSS
jgi:2-polyprenyl-3-methyl-5-hydroxy-6-metoxy-1,4-benzoquinol methylase